MHASLLSVTSASPDAGHVGEPDVLDADRSDPSLDEDRQAGEAAPPQAPLLRRLSGSDGAAPGRRTARSAAAGTILEARPPRAGTLSKHRRTLRGWMTRLTGPAADHGVGPQDEPLREADGLDDIRREIDRSFDPAEPNVVDAEKRLSLALSKAGWLAEEIAKCQQALEEARGSIRAEELRLARLRGFQDGAGAQPDAAGSDLDAIEATLATLRRVVDRLDTPRG